MVVVSTFHCQDHSKNSFFGTFDLVASETACMDSRNGSNCERIKQMSRPSKHVKIYLSAESVFLVLAINTKRV